ncbi:cellulose synthase subunit BcsC-related outer membrane protein [Limnobacter litoralis]|uniref:cellulose synthase subunit BcsC-related outer membrane protein n=1 Tax=Limnobacter litoralis TaxID=481366 RepID=UPI0024E08464|nr:cellulose synthase subunit BcsC-related outer membrane protein [Limnobacter litoralis]
MACNPGRGKADIVAKQIWTLSTAGLLLAATQGGAYAVATPNAGTPTQSVAEQTLLSKGIYWINQYRYDLAVQAFNKILLTDPHNSEALKWQGLVDMAKGNTRSAQVWLNRLQSEAGADDPNTIELRQTIELATTKRQKFAEIKFRANTEQARSGRWADDLKSLFDRPPLGQAAVEYYKVLNQDANSRPAVRQAVEALIRQFPEDPRYRTLLADLGYGKGELNSPPQVANSAPALTKQTPRTKTKAPDTPKPPAVVQPPNPETAKAAGNPEKTPELSTFDQAKQLSDDADQLLVKGETAKAEDKWRAAIAKVPDYAWFRYSLASALNDQKKPQEARDLMETGLALKPNDPDMIFASVLIASQQNRDQDALALLNRVPKDQWSSGMSGMERRLSYNQYLDRLRAAQRRDDYNQVAGIISETPRWRAEPEVQALEKEIRMRTSPRIQMSTASSKIDGSAGVSGIKTQEIPLQVDLPLDANQTLFVRADSLKAEAGTVDPATANTFAQVGTVVTNSPAVQQNLLNQNFSGQVVGIGLQQDRLRLDLGTTTGNLPVNDWVGGVQWKTDLGPGSLRLELARRMVSGSVLSMTGAIDPVSGQAWGGARRNGVSAVVYEPITPTLDFVGIARANLITGHHVPDNTELNAQGILSKTIYQKAGQKVEVGASLFLWKFDKNLRYYTYGQGGYYSPQSFASLTLPITWTGSTEKWSWQAQLGIGASQSRESDANLYPLDPQLAQQAAAQGNPTVIAGGKGGGASTSFKLALERQVLPSLALGTTINIDRSQGYNPDVFSVYLKYSFLDEFPISRPPEPLVPYSRF